MGINRRRVLARLAMASAAPAAASGLQMGTPAAAAGQLPSPLDPGPDPNGPRQFLFGPVMIPGDQWVLVHFANLTRRPTPPATLEFFNSDTGHLYKTVQIPSTTPPVGGEGRLGSLVEGAAPAARIVARLTFADPRGNQAIPSPFAASLEIHSLATDATSVVLPPARRGGDDRAYFFGPVTASPGPEANNFWVMVHYANLGQRPTPPATLEFFDSANGFNFTPQPIQIRSAKPPAGDGNEVLLGGQFFQMVARLTFAEPTNNQAIPSPFAATIEVQDQVTGQIFAILPVAR